MFLQEKMNQCRRMPCQLIQYLNLTKSICKICYVPNSVTHCRKVHGISLPDLEEVLELTSKYQKKKISRKEAIQEIRKVIEPFLKKLKSHVNNQHGIVYI